MQLKLIPYDSVVYKQYKFWKLFAEWRLEIVKNFQFAKL